MLPDYRGGSIVNLMSSVCRGFGRGSRYGALRILPGRDLQRKVVMLVIDGMGYEFLKRRRGFLWEHCRGSMTSVLPATTASAITSFKTGLAPSEHGFTGWFMHLRELGLVAAVLRGTVRGGSLFNPDFLFTKKPVFDRLPKPCIVQPKELTDSVYTKRLSGRAAGLPYNTLQGMVRQIVRASKTHRFVYAYWDALDAFSHHFGPDGALAVRHFRELEAAVRMLARGIRDCTLIVTADHGQIETSRQMMVHLDDHPKLAEMLTVPLSGESRLAYCYVRAHRARDFENYIRKRLSHACHLRRSRSFARHFGPRPTKEFLQRIGDYVLIMKGRHTIQDELPGERRHFHRGVHGGLSEEEMLVPLVVLEL